jgi:tetratricopeptide (TPR) repeat protein
MALCLLLAAVAIWFFALRQPIAQAREAMRMARYDTALAKLESIPDWLSAWPPARILREDAGLGTRFHEPRPNWEDLGRELRRLRKQAPRNADLMVLEATYWLRREDYGQVRKAAEAATGADPLNAEAWFMRGLLEDLAGRPALAEAHYRKAHETAPDSPQYLNNLAHSLLARGGFDQAIGEYRKISRFPLARLEQALGLWAMGEPERARDAQGEALTMLADAALMADFYNRRAWWFTLQSFGVRLSSLADKRCYAGLEEAASRRLAGDAGAAFPPAACAEPPTEIRQLVADDLCRYVAGPQPALAPLALELRRALGQPAACPAPAPGPPPGTRS